MISVSPLNLPRSNQISSWGTKESPSTQFGMDQRDPHLESAWFWDLGSTLRRKIWVFRDQNSAYMAYALLSYHFWHRWIDIRRQKRLQSAWLPDTKLWTQSKILMKLETFEAHNFFLFFHTHLFRNGSGKAAPKKIWEKKWYKGGKASSKRNCTSYIHPKLQKQQEIITSLKPNYWSENKNTKPPLTIPRKSLKPTNKHWTWR